MIMPSKCKECLETINYKSQHDLDFQRKELIKEFEKMIDNMLNNICNNLGLTEPEQR